ncbi:hypothetical protein QSJ18_18275 [Gordonia sp. ABSL1-1]|uniref:hypothetical protein n=1 Tax=Gordonia sp. ABSL1-1 TaxID=3053923 RepID=UPI002573E156|nr:hypothetical protein [Gordonia sp. ABSL1-1]MDL9938697.1 hypothetical protein [Gordonia sp. ABSL1-1]
MSAHRDGIPVDVILGLAMMRGERSRQAMDAAIRQVLVGISCIPGCASIADELANVAGWVADAVAAIERDAYAGNSWRQLAEVARSPEMRAALAPEVAA